MKYIYLDQNVWRILEDVEYKNITENKYIQFHKIAEQIVDSGKAIFPYSFINLFELHGIPNQKKKEKAVKVILKFSKNTQINMFPIVWKLELENEIIKRVGIIKEYDLIPKIFNNDGLMNYFGIKTQLKFIDKNEKNEENIKQKIREKLTDHKILLKTLANPSFSKVYEQMKRENQAILLHLEKNRKKDKKEKPHMRKKIRRFQFISQQIIDPFFEICQKYNIEPDETKLFQKRGVNNKRILKKFRQNFEKFLKCLRAHYTYHILTISRDWDFSRDIDINDNNDISALSVAIPYCDIVITEKYFKTLAKQNQLHELYNTKILDLGEIDQLNSLI